MVHRGVIVSDNFPFPQDGDSIADGEDMVQVVCYHYAGFSVLLQVLDQLEYLP